MKVQLLRKEEIMNAKKYKSIAVQIEIYEMLQKLAEAEDRSPGKQIANLVKREWAAHGYEEEEQAA